MFQITIAATTALMICSSAFAQGAVSTTPASNPALNTNATVPGKDVGVPANGDTDAKSGSMRSDGGTATGGPVGGPMTGGGK